MNQETTAEFEVAALVEIPKLTARAKVTVAGKTDLGRVRENNEDKHEFFIPEDEATLARRGMIFIVCDGMGGHAAGQIASELSVKTFIDVYLNHPSAQPEEAMDSAVKAAHRFVMDQARAIPARRGMGTTLTALALLGNRAYVAHVGDSRLYRLRGEELTQMTEDHTWVDEAIRRGELPPEAALTHPYRHALTRAIGGEDQLVPDIFFEDFEAGDVFLLCSDGLVNHVDDAAIKQTLLESGPGEACWKLVGKALVDGGSDNTTVLIVRVDELTDLS